MEPLDAVILRASCQNSRPFVITLDDYTISTTSGVEQKKTARIYNGQRGSNPFTNKVYCASCGSKCERDTWTKGTKVWACSQPRTKCRLKRLPESELKEAAESFFGDGYEGQIVQNVERIVISDHEVVFHLKEGDAYRWQRQ